VSTHDLVAQQQQQQPQLESLKSIIEKKWKEVLLVSTLAIIEIGIVCTCLSGFF
jgi:hypothetical protein